MASGDTYARTHAEQVAADVTKRYGILTSVNRFNHIVISESAHRQLKDAVWADRRLDALGRGYYLGAVDIETAPDWTFSPVSVAWARLIATLLIQLHARAVLAIINRWTSRLFSTT